MMQVTDNMDSKSSARGKPILLISAVASLDANANREQLRGSYAQVRDGWWPIAHVPECGPCKVS
jgi:hypothetical protein